MYAESRHSKSVLIRLRIDEPYAEMFRRGVPGLHSDPDDRSSNYRLEAWPQGKN